MVAVNADLSEPAGPAKTKTGKIAELFVYDNFNRVPAERVEAGDICAFTGLPDVGIGETVCARDAPNALPTIEVGCPSHSQCSA